MSAAELAEWQAFYRLEPFGPMADDLRHASMSHLMAVAHLKPRDGDGFKPRDFALADWGDEPALNDEDGPDLFDQLERAFGAFFIPDDHENDNEAG